MDLDNTKQDKVRGCLMAGAAGDALGYEVEFMSRRIILARFGEQGITEFALDSNGKATATNGGDYVCVGVSYNLAAYIAAMIDGVESTSAAIDEATDAAVITELEIKLAEYETALTAAKALYAYSLVANEYAK